MVIGTVAGYQLLKDACKAANRRIPICCIKTHKNDSIPEGAVDFSEIIDPKHCDFSQLKPTGITIDDMVVLPYSSGTTGMPKGVMLSHKNITVNCEMTYTRSPYAPLLEDTTETVQEVCPGILPFFHIYGLSLIMLAKLKMGCKLVTMPRFNPDDLIKTLYEQKASILYLVPPISKFEGSFMFELS